MSFHILGDQDSILGFSFAGVPGTAVATAEDALEAFDSIVARPTVRILIVTEPVGAMIEERITEHRLTTEPPYVVQVPDIWDTPVERRTLEQTIQEAVGIRIVKEPSESSETS